MRKYAENEWYKDIDWAKAGGLGAGGGLAGFLFNRYLLGNKSWTSNVLSSIIGASLLGGGSAAYDYFAGSSGAKESKKKSDIRSKLRDYSKSREEEKSDPKKSKESDEAALVRAADKYSDGLISVDTAKRAGIFGAAGAGAGRVVSEVADKVGGRKPTEIVVVNNEGKVTTIPTKQSKLNRIVSGPTNPEVSVGGLDSRQLQDVRSKTTEYGGSIKSTKELKDAIAQSRLSRHNARAKAVEREINKANKSAYDAAMKKYKADLALWEKTVEKMRKQPAPPGFYDYNPSGIFEPSIPPPPTRPSLKEAPVIRSAEERFAARRYTPKQVKAWALKQSEKDLARRGYSKLGRLSRLGRSALRHAPIIGFLLGSGSSVANDLVQMKRLDERAKKYNLAD